MFSGLTGKVAVVTGGAGGLGSASARRLSREGCRVVVVDIDGEGARKVAAELPGESAWVQADVATGEGVDEYLAVTTRTFGKIDFHHLNAGIPGSLAGFPDADPGDFDRVMAVNVRGVFLGLRGSADVTAYQTSKHAVLGLVRGATQGRQEQPGV